MRNPYLLKAKKVLEKQGYYVAFKGNSILDICEKKDELPFIQLIVEEEQFPGIIISYSADFTDVYKASDLIINISNISPVALSEAFYFGDDEKCYFGQEAFKKYSEDAIKHMSEDNLINEIPLVNKEIH